MLSSTERLVLQRKIESLLETLNPDAQEASDILAALIYTGPKNRYQHKVCAWADLERSYDELQKSLAWAGESIEGASDLEIKEMIADMEAS